MYNLTIMESIGFVQLSWEMSTSLNLTFEYEVAYINDTDCTLNTTTALHDYELNTVNTTTNTSIEVYGLMSDTCYVFAVINGACIDMINGITSMESNVSLQ